MKIVQRKTESMFQRETVLIEFESTSTTPSRKFFQAEIAKKEKVDPSLVVVSLIKKKNGLANVTVTAQIYANKDSFKRFVPLDLQKTSEIKEEKAKEEA